MIGLNLYIKKFDLGKLRWAACGLMMALVTLVAPVAADPDSPEVAFLGLADGTWQCWVMQSDGSGARQVTRSAHDKMRVSWYPDGQRLLVNSADGFAYEVSLDTGQEKRIATDLSGFQDAVIAPGGERMAFSLSTSGSRDDNNIWVSDLLSGELDKVTAMPWLQHEPVWGPDGQVLFFLSGEGGQTHDIWKVGLADGKTTQLTAHRAYHFDVSVADDGTLVYSNNRDGSYDLWLRAPEGNERKLTDHPALDARPSWSPDGRKLVFESGRNGGPDLWLLDLETSELSRLTHTEGGSRAPVWYHGEASQ